MYNVLGILKDASDAVANDTTNVPNNGESNLVSWEQVWEKVVSWCTTTGLRLIIAILLLIISFALINFITKKVYKRLQKKKVDATITKVAYNSARIILKVVVLVCLVGYVGIETASISALIASLGVGISLAVQGTLSNFAAGVIIIIMRPFKLGDFITSNGVSGTVDDIKLFYTTIITPDNKVIYIPNGSLANNVIVNVSVKDTRRVDVCMPVSYDTDVNKAKQVILDVINKNKEILSTPEPFIKIGNFADSAIELYVRVWVKSENYWNVNFYLLEEIRKAFEENNIEIPFNQLDVTIKK